MPVIGKLSLPGNFRALFLNFSPTGEKHKTTCKFDRTLDKKYSYKFSLVGGSRGYSFFMVGTSSCVISSISSRANRLETY